MSLVISKDTFGFRAQAKENWSVYKIVLSCSYSSLDYTTKIKYHISERLPLIVFVSVKSTELFSLIADVSIHLWASSNRLYYLSLHHNGKDTVCTRLISLATALLIWLVLSLAAWLWVSVYYDMVQERCIFVSKSVKFMNVFPFEDPICLVYLLCFYESSARTEVPICRFCRKFRKCKETKIRKARHFIFKGWQLMFQTRNRRKQNYCSNKHHFKNGRLYINTIWKTLVKLQK